MTSEGLGEVFKGDSADMCAGKFPLVSMGGRANGQACADGERGPPSERAEIPITYSEKAKSSEARLITVQYRLYTRQDKSIFHCQQNKQIIANEQC